MIKETQDIPSEVSYCAVSIAKLQLIPGGIPVLLLLSVVLRAQDLN